MEKNLEQLFYTALGGALAVKDKLEANSEEIKAWQEKSEEHEKTFHQIRHRNGKDHGNGNALVQRHASPRFH